jgi:hypothetical protein
MIIMKEIIVIAGIVLIAVVMLAIGVTEIKDVDIKNMEIKSLSTDKDAYFSRETMTISLLLHSRIESDADIEIRGISDKLRISQAEHLNIGDNNITFQYETPSCYGCAGISPGEYNITAYIRYNNKTIESPVHWIELKS